MAVYNPAFSSGVVTTFPDAATGTALTAGGANAYGALANVSGALAAASRLVSLDLDTPAVAIEPCQWELSYAAGVTVVATGMVGFDTAVGTYPAINLIGVGGVIPAGATLAVQDQERDGRHDVSGASLDHARVIVTGPSGARR